jgi:hypothetical protein
MAATSSRAAEHERDQAERRVLKVVKKGGKEGFRPFHAICAARLLGLVVVRGMLVGFSDGLRGPFP